MNLTLKATTSLVTALALLALLSAPRSYAASGEWNEVNSDQAWSDSRPEPPPPASEPVLPTNPAPQTATIAHSSDSTTSKTDGQTPNSVSSAPLDAKPAPDALTAAPALPSVPVHLTSISKDAASDAAGIFTATSPFVHSQPRAVAPFPLLLNRSVQNYVEDFLDQPKGLKLAFDRSRPFMSEMIKLLKQQGVPDDLVYLTFAESDFSKQGKGPWQFTFDTAARFGLRVNKWLDERRDPILSTKAAAEYLAELHDQADNDWRVALIGWNTGEGNLARYWLLEGANYEKFADRLPRRTRQLLNRFMAVAFIAHNSASYGIGDTDYSHDEPGWTTHLFKGGTLLSSIARKFETTVAKLRDLNPALRADRVPPNERTYSIRVPSDDEDSY